MPEDTCIQKNVVILAHPSPKIEFALTIELKGQQAAKRPADERLPVVPGGSRKV
jgi:hypothetical protein